jgi:hypothetical protein
MSVRSFFRLRFALVVVFAVLLPAAQGRADFLILRNGETLEGEVERQSDGSYITKESKYAYGPDSVARVSKAETVKEVIKNWSKELKGAKSREKVEQYLYLAKLCIYHGKYNDASKHLRAWAKPRAGWKAHASNYYFILSSADPKRIAEVKSRLDAIVNVYKKGFKHKGRLKREFIVRFFATRNEFEHFCNSIGGGGGAAFYSSSLRELVLWDMSAYSKQYTFEAVYHEANHQFVDSYYFKHSTKHMWFSEGFACYYENVKYKGGEIMNFGRVNEHYYAEALKAINRKRHTPLRQFLKMGIRSFYGGNKTANYAQAWSLVYFFMKTKDGKMRKFLTKYMTVLRDTKDDDKALAEASKIADAEAVEKAWLAFTKKL